MYIVFNFGYFFFKILYLFIKLFNIDMFYVYSIDFYSGIYIYGFIFFVVFDVI